MATKYVTAKGYIRWAHLYEPDTYGEGPAAAVRYITNFHPFDEAEKDKIIQSGSRLTFKPYNDDSGIEYIRPRRDQFKVFTSGKIEYTPPMITGLVDVKYVDQNGDQIWSLPTDGTVEMKREGTPITLWNDTLVNITLAVYDSSFGKGTRLQSVEVLEFGKSPEEQEQEEQEETKEEDTSPSSTNPDADKMPF